MFSARKYFSVDGQLKIKNRIGFTECRVELVSGTQSASSNSSETPGTLFTGTDGYYVRNFSGGYLYFLQHLGNTHHQLGIKYDWYDPNTIVSGSDIGKSGSNINAANIKYSTLGFGYINFCNINFIIFLVL